MEKWKFRKEMLGLSRFLLILFFIYSIVNGIGIVRFDIDGMHTFLKYFNGVVMFGILSIIIFLDICNYNIIEYGTLRNPKRRRLSKQERGEE